MPDQSDCVFYSLEIFRPSLIGSNPPANFSIYNIPITQPRFQALPPGFLFTSELKLNEGNLQEFEKHIA